MKLRTLFYFVVFMFLQQFVSAQPWTELLPDDKDASELTLFDYQKAFNDYWKPYNVKGGYYFDDKGKKNKVPGWKQFKRWEWFWEPRVDPKTGVFPEISTDDLIGQYYNVPQQMPMGLNAANWSSLGPNSSSGGYAGVGRLNCIAFHPTDNNTFWVGAPSGGIWRTTDGGASWTVLNDGTGVIGVSDIIVPSDYDISNTLYIATGDRDAWDNKSIGVLKSTDGGATWNATDLVYQVSQPYMPTRSLLDPNDDDHIVACTVNDGIQSTTDGGATWNQLSAPDWDLIDMEYKPGDFNTLYVGTEYSGTVRTSTDGGMTWVEALNTSGDGGQRVELAVTPANPNVVYALIARGRALLGVYRSDDSGVSFSLVYDGTVAGQNLLDGGDGSDPSYGQGWYDLSLGVSPTDEDVVFVGGVNTWKSTDGGASFTLNNHWYGGYGVQAVHADKHKLIFRENGDLFECNDGGVYISSDVGGLWQDITNGMVTSQIYRIGVAQTVPNDVISGLQDNGSKNYNSGVWNDVWGGDGMQCAIDYTNANVQYVESQYGGMGRTDDHWVTAQSIKPTTTNGAWITPFVIDPIDPNTIYAGFDTLYKSTDKGDTWTDLATDANLSHAGKFNQLAVAPSDNQYIYVTQYNNIWKTTDGGTTWTDISTGLPGNDITWVSVKNDAPQTIWVTVGSYNGSTVYESTDGGNSWSDISTGLPQVPTNCVIQNKLVTSQVDLYAGTDNGVYYKAGAANWVPFNGGLPNVIVNEVEIYYDETNPENSIMRAATYGRGLWETEIMEDIDIEPCSALFFSEYVEGSSNNKYLELYNPTCEDITLDGNYSIKIYNNGNTSANTTINLIGTIPAQGTFVIAHNNYDNTLYTGTVDMTANISFNGDDAIELLQGTGATATTLDVIGQIGNDPGSQWGSGNTSTANNTIVRKSSISKGDNDGSDAFDPSVEWDGYATDDISHLGSHTIDPTACPVPAEPTLTIVNNTCTPVVAGTITATGCGGTEEELQWSTDGGTTWSTTAPTYGTTAITVQVKCVNTSTGCESPVATGTTSPNDCGSIGSGAIFVNYGGPNIVDPCTCADDCMFDEEVVVISVPGEMWTVVTNNGFFTPGTTTVIAPGTPLVVNPANPAQYTLVGQHEDGIGYFLTVTNGTDVLSIGNMCTDTPVFDTKLACDTIACGDDFPTDVPTVSDRCNRTIDINVVDTIEVTDYSCTGDGGFLVGGPQITTGVPPTFPLAPYSIASGAPFDFATGDPTFALLNGLGFNCDEKSGASLYGLLLDGTGIPSLVNRPKVNLVKIHLPYNAPDKPEILGTIVEPPLSTVSAGETAVSTVLNYIGDAKDNKFYVAGVSVKYTGDPALGTPVNVTEAIPYLGIIDLNSCSAGAVSISPNWMPIDMTNLSCAAYGSSFIQDLNDYFAGTLSVFPSGGIHDWAVSPDGSTLYSFMGITKNGANGTDDDGALIAINIADGMATCTPGDAGNDPYTGMDGASTEEFAGMYFNGAGELMGWQSDMGRLFSIDIPTAALTLEEDGLPVDYRGDAASCYACEVPQSCEDNIVKREYRVIEAKDECDNVNYQYHLIVTQDETDVTLEKDTMVCESDPDVIFRGTPVPDQAAGDVASFEIIPTLASFVDNTDGTATFDPGAAGAGTWQVVYTFNKVGACCAKTDTVEVVVIASPPAPTVSDIEVCEGGDTEIVPQSNTTGGGSCVATSDLIITGVVDGPLTGGAPKGVELYVVNDIADLSEYGLGSANNGGGSDGEEFTFPADAVTAGTYIWVATEATEFNSFFGFAPTYTHGQAPNINGDDAIELFHSGAVVDVFGDINVDGTGQAWEYMDGWAYRNSDAGNSTTFSVADWTFSGANALDGATTNTGATTPMPNGTYSCVQATSLFNFYSDITLTTLEAGPVASYDPGTTPATSPQTFWVTEINTVTGCESEAVEVTVTVHPQPSAEVGANEFYCGLPTTINLDVNSSESGTWTMRGGSGTIDDVMGDHTSYTPVADDLDTTIVFVWTTIPTGVAGCDAASDSFAVTIVSETADAEFTYSGTEFCPGSSNPTVSHTTGVDGIYTYTVIANGTNLVIDKHTGEIDMTASDAGTYEITNTVDGKGNLIITGVIDGTIPGGLPKAIELYAIRDITDLSRYGLESANNGSGINGVEYTFPDDAVAAGTYIWVSTEFATFNSYFGFEPTYVNNIAQINGDDAILLYNDGQIIDVFGQPDVDGTGEAWEYSNSWAYRKSNTGLDGSLFDIDNWTFGGVDALNGSTNDGDVANPFPDGTFTTDFEAGCASDQHSEIITIGDLETPVVACPGDMTIHLDPGECSAYPFWDGPEATDNCDDNPTITQLSGPNSGDELTLHGGPYVVVYEITDASGNSVVCNLNITLEGYPTPTDVLACNDTVQVSVDTSCLVQMNADMFLEGGPYQCYNLFEVYVDHPLFEGDNVSNQIISLGTGVYNVTVLDAANNNNSCETVIIVLDKMPPTIDCEDCPVGGILSTGSAMTEYKGNLDDFDPTGITNVCWAFEGFYPISPAPHSIEVIKFSVDVAGSYTFSMESLWGDQDGEMALYDQPVDYSNLCEGIVAGSNDVGGVGAYDPGITINLQPGTYYLAVSSYDPAVRGEFIVTFTAPVDADVIYLGPNIYDEKCQFVGCFSPNDIYDYPELVYDDNCEVTIDSVDEVLEGPLCGTKLVRRTYTVTDGAGNTANCTKEFFFRGVDMSNFTWPRNWDDLPSNNPKLLCDQDYPRDNQGNPHPEYTGYPDGYDKYCGTVEVFYNDVVYGMEDGVPCGWKILRYWTVVDDCTGLITKKIQVIMITDKTAPTFMSPAPAVTVSTGAYLCEGDYHVPVLEHMEDNCSDEVGYYVISEAGEVVFVNGGWQVRGLPLGTTEVCYVVYDACDNKDTACVAVTVEDLVPPIAVCEQFKQVSLTVEGTAVICAEDFDSGSLDNCNDVSFKVRRMDDGGLFHDCVNFACDDVGDTVMVTLRVYDRDLEPGSVSASAYEGHYNDCMSNVEVACKLPPVLNCKNLTVSCDAVLDFDNDASLRPDVQAVCLTSLTHGEITSTGDDVCSQEKEVVWIAEGCGQTVSCTQKITFEGDEDFDPCTIQMPADASAVCTDPVDNSHPEYDEGPCDVVTYELIKADTFKFVEGACYKIVREWAVIDWCVYEPNTGAEDDVDVWKGNRKLDCKDAHYADGYDGYYKYSQVLMMVDNEAPEISVEDTCVGTVDCNAYPVELTAIASDTCNPLEEFHWKYRIFDMDTWEVVQYSHDYVPEYGSGNVGKNDELDNVVEGKIVLNNPLPIGTYKVEWVVGDGCGNVTTESQVVEVVDNKAPTPILVDLSTALMTNCMVEICAVTFDKGGCDGSCLSSFDNCTEKEGLYFTFTPVLPKLDVNPAAWASQYNTYGKYFYDPQTGLMSNQEKYLLGEALAWNPDTRSSCKVYGIDRDGNGPDLTQYVDVYVWDQFAENNDCDFNNYDYATAVLILNDDNDDCPGAAPIISGMVSSCSDENAGVGEVSVTFDDGERVRNGFSLSDGTYTVGLSDSNYDVKASKEVEGLSGLSTLDIVMIQKHILGIDELTDPCQIASMDVNKNGKITASDILVLRKKILGKTTPNKHWNFMDEAYMESYDRFDLKDAYTKSVLVENGTTNDNMNFVAVLAGDVNMSAVGTVESRSGEVLSFEMDNSILEEGQVVEVPVYAKNFSDVRGGQFAISLNNLKLKEVNFGSLNVTESNYNVVEDNLLVSWNEGAGQSIADGEVLFTLVVEATSNVSLSEALSLNDSRLSAEAYKGVDLEISSVELSYRNASYALYQNNPNPFSNVTEIGFELPEAAEYTLTIYDVTGKLVKVITEEGKAGYNTKTINRKDLRQSGVLYYRLESGDYTATKKMVILK